MFYSRAHIPNLLYFYLFAEKLEICIIRFYKHRIQIFDIVVFFIYFLSPARRL